MDLLKYFRKSKTDVGAEWNLRLALSEVENLYALRAKENPGTEMYAELSKRIREETATVENLAKAISHGKVKRNIDVEKILAALIAAGANLAMLELAMRFQEEGHLLDFKSLTFYKMRQ